MWSDWPPAVGKLSQPGALEPLRPGAVRPVLASYPGVQRMSRAGLRLLLYVDEVALDAALLAPVAFTPLGQVEAEQPARGIRLLAHLRPLIEDGALQFIGGVRVPDPEHHRILEQSAQGLWDEDSRLDLYGPAAMALLLQSGLGAYAEGSGTPLALTHNEQVALEAILDFDPIDGGPAEMAKLARVPVPDYSNNIGDLVSLRRNSDRLASFRSALADALSLIGTLPASDSQSARAAEILADSLQSRLSAVRKEADSSPLKSALRGASRRLGFTAIGAVAGASVASSLGLPFIGAAVGAASGTAINLAETGRDVRSAASTRREARAVWRLVAAFTPTAELGEEARTANSAFGPVRVGTSR